LMLDILEFKVHPEELEQLRQCQAKPRVDCHAAFTVRGPETIWSRTSSCASGAELLWDCSGCRLAEIGPALALVPSAVLTLWSIAGFCICVSRGILRL